METKIYKTAKEFFKFLNNYEADIWIEAKSSCLEYCSKFALCLMAIAFSLC